MGLVVKEYEDMAKLIEVVDMKMEEDKAHLALTVFILSR